MKEYYQEIVKNNKSYFWDRLNQILYDDSDSLVEFSWFDSRTGEILEERCFPQKDFIFEFREIVQVADREHIANNWVAEVEQRSVDPSNGKKNYKIAFAVNGENEDWIREDQLIKRNSFVDFQFCIGNRVTWGTSMLQAVIVGYLPGHSPILYRAMMMHNGQLRECIVEESEIRGYW